MLIHLRVDLPKTIAKNVRKTNFIQHTFIVHR